MFCGRQTKRNIEYNGDHLMAYIGNAPADRFTSIPTVQQFNGDGSTTAFTLSRPVGTDQDLLVSVDGVIQDTAAYAVSNGTTLTFSAAPSSGTANIFVNYLGVTIGSVVHPASSALAATTGTFSDAVNFAANATFADNVQAIFGTGSDANIRHDGNNTKISHTGSGGLYIGADILGLQNGAHSATHLSIDANGHVTKPLQPAFWVRPASTQSNVAADGSTVTIVWGTETFDVNADFASNTFTAPVTGKYFMHVRLNLQSIDRTASYYQVNIVTSNAAHSFIQDPRGLDTDPNHFVFNVSAVADMDASDTATVTIVQPNGTAQTDIIHTSSYSSWYGYLLG